MSLLSKKTTQKAVVFAWILGLAYYVYTRYDDDTIEHLGSDYSHSFYGVSSWNGWPY